ncbi:secondary thiamine-phosphate synthase enzyme YjbQ [Thermosipho atlanticus]|uniref:Secondary thiamine-phosphate synthase enzyme n=1 Tax=Thermosipho atlanticus DSM 15807 TaxID=1123380 RepID=A0A1M5SZM0_9BACT|nr:secondary thiamine-phosphate synthase enzyme YjbQ [Thermosipho atlanticus]SHH43954.1 secondary thiamine-phosphate synthase enzyme [Thermosipho atlanticus DSM 15807]
MLFAFEVKTEARNILIDITSRIEELVRKSGVKSGLCVVYVPHTTAGITINENADPSVKYDIENTLSKIVPSNLNYTHLEGNSDSHVKSTLVSPSITLIIDNGHLLLGTWQGVYFCEFDGPRRRKVYIKIIED